MFSFLVVWLGGILWVVRGYERILGRFERLEYGYE